MSDAGEHWLDRLAERQTRGRLLKRGLVAAIFTLPLARALPVSATSWRAGCESNKGSTPGACRRGCVYNAAVKGLHARQACVSPTSGATTILASFGLDLVYGEAPFGFVGLAGVLAGKKIASYVSEQGCRDQALLAQKDEEIGCFAPYCPDFDPCELAYCAACGIGGGQCCPDGGAKFGFQCCGHPPGACCSKSGNGCGSGTTECSG